MFKIILCGVGVTRAERGSSETERTGEGMWQKKEVCS